MTLTKNNTVYENENYVVVIDDDVVIDQGGVVFTAGYAVQNKATGVKEFISPAMPEALFASEQLNHALLNKVWEWRREQKPEPVNLNPDLLVN